MLYNVATKYTMAAELLSNTEKIQRASRVEAWKKEPTHIIDYPGGVTPDGKSYPAGRRLIIAGEQVMDTCETPWCKAAVEDVFEEIRLISEIFDNNPNVFKPPLRVLERGHGLGISGRFIIQKLISLGRPSSYTVIELNHMVANAARNWQESLEHGLKALAYGLVDTLPQIEMRIIEKDAYEATDEFIKNGEQFDIIFSDTYPLTEAESGSNDIGDIDLLKRCLSPNGRLAYFGLDLASTHVDPYTYEKTGGIIGNYKIFINEHFETIRVHLVEVNPAPDYLYLHKNGIPIKKLPAITCIGPKFN